MKTLPTPDSFFLAAAEGWLGLGNWREAESEFHRISPAFQDHPDVVRVSYLIAAEADNWKKAIKSAQKLTTLSPENPFGWIQTAFSLDKLGQTKEAYDFLLNALERFPNDILIRYNLACFAARSGNLGLAWQWLDKTFALGVPQELKDIAVNDNDLKPLWLKMSASHFAPSVAIRFLAWCSVNDPVPNSGSYVHKSR